MTHSFFSCQSLEESEGCIKQRCPVFGNGILCQSISQSLNWIMLRGLPQELSILCEAPLISFALSSAMTAKIRTVDSMVNSKCLFMWTVTK